MIVWWRKKVGLTTNEKHPTTEMRLDALLSVYISEIYEVISGQRAGADLLLVFR